MKDLTGVTHSFQEWSALLNFLATMTKTKVKDIRIARKKDNEWMMNIRTAAEDTKAAKISRGASLYDLYW